MALRLGTLSTINNIQGIENIAAVPPGKNALDRPVTHRQVLGDVGNKENFLPAGMAKDKGFREDFAKKGHNEVTRKGPVTRGKTTTTSKAPSPLPMDISAAEDKEVGSQTESNLVLHVEDVDEKDGDNPQLVSEYVNDIYTYMRHLEKKYPVRPRYLLGQIVSGKMRAMLVDWLVEVHLQFQLLQETLYLTIAIIDRFLQERNIPRNKLQLVGVTAMFIASKYEEMYSPEIGDFVYITDNAYTKMQIRQMEAKMLEVLGFSFGRPLPLHFLRRNSKVGQADALQHTLAKYVMELCLPEYEMCHYPPSQIAAAALCLSFRVLGGSSCEEVWTNTLIHYSKYQLKDLVPVMNRMAALIVKSETSKFQAIRKKYMSKKFMKISCMAKLKVQVIKDMAACSS